LKDQLSDLHNKLDENTANHEDEVQKLKDEMVKKSTDHEVIVH
jgi:hypothetical protein